MLILLLFFDTKQRTNTQLYAYLLNFFVLWSKLPKAYFRISYAPESDAAERSFRETSCFLTILQKNAYPTILQIKQQEHTLRCQLKFVARD